MKRIQGFVVGYDKVAGELLWTVKVKDENSQHNGQKFLVASLHPRTMLTRPGADVTFRVQPFGTEQEKVLRAVDVSVGKTFPEEKPIVERIPDALAIAVTDEEGCGFTAWHNECDSIKEVQELFDNRGGEGTLVGLIRITPELVLHYGGAISDEEAVAGLATLRQMMHLEPIRDIVCAVAMEAFKIGRESRDTNQNPTEK